MLLGLAWAWVSSVQADPDFGVSYNLLLRAALADDWFVVSRSNLATRDDNRESFLRYTGAALGRQLDDAWSLRAGYRRAWLKRGGRWQGEDRPFLEAYFGRRLGDWRLSNRARIEWRLFERRDDDVRLRNEIGLEAPAMTRRGLHPFVEDEVFYGLDADRLEANWLTLGLAWRPARGTKLKLGYRRNRFRVNEQWRDRDVLVLGVNLFF